MDEIMLMKYLQGKGFDHMSEDEFMHKFKNFMSKYKRDSYTDYNDDDYYNMNSRGYNIRRYNDYPEYDSPEFDYEDSYSKMGRNMHYSKQRRMNQPLYEDHITEQQARTLVSKMYHIEKGKKHVGEKYDMHKAKEILERYRGIIPKHVTPCDIYVAINAQYHDYGELFTSWFGDNIDHKIIESAIVFWFKDVDFEGDNKLMYYFDVM